VSSADKLRLTAAILARPPCFLRTNPSAASTASDQVMPPPDRSGSRWQPSEPAASIGVAVGVGVALGVGASAESCTITTVAQWIDAHSPR